MTKSGGASPSWKRVFLSVSSSKSLYCLEIFCAERASRRLQPNGTSSDIDEEFEAVSTNLKKRMLERSCPMATRAAQPQIPTSQFPTAAQPRHRRFGTMPNRSSLLRAVLQAPRTEPNPHLQVSKRRGPAPVALAGAGAAAEFDALSVTQSN